VKIIIISILAVAMIGLMIPNVFSVNQMYDNLGEKKLGDVGITLFQSNDTGDLKFEHSNCLNESCLIVFEATNSMGDNRNIGDFSITKESPSHGTLSSCNLPMGKYIIKATLDSSSNSYTTAWVVDIKQKCNLNYDQSSTSSSSIPPSSSSSTPESSLPSFDSRFVWLIFLIPAIIVIAIIAKRWKKPKGSSKGGQFTKGNRGSGSDDDKSENIFQDYADEIHRDYGDQFTDTNQTSWSRREKFKRISEREIQEERERRKKSEKVAKAIIRERKRIKVKKKSIEKISKSDILKNEGNDYAVFHLDENAVCSEITKRFRELSKKFQASRGAANKSDSEVKEDTKIQSIINGAYSRLKKLHCGQGKR
jgi:hypothetical protein